MPAPQAHAPVAAVATPAACHWPLLAPEKSSGDSKVLARDKIVATEENLWSCSLWVCPTRKNSSWAVSNFSCVVRYEKKFATY